jgi:hypothetical protein
MLKLYIYGHQNKVRSSRRLQRETERNVEVMWLLNGLSPDDKTICNFRKDNRKALKEVFRMFNKLCLSLGLFGRETVAIDGTKQKANNSRNNHYTLKETEKLLSKKEKQITEYLNELEKNDNAEREDGTPSREAIEKALLKLSDSKDELLKILEKIKENDGNPVCTIDEDAALMKRSGGSFDICYNIQTSGDEKHGLIVDYNVTNHANDICELSDMASRSKEMLEVDNLNALADTGYSNGLEIHKCEEMEVTCYVPKAKPSHQPKNECFSRDKFIYDSEKNTYTCPAGNEMPQVRTRKRDGFKVYANRSACKVCPLKNQCTKSETLREIERSPYQENIDRAAQNAEDNPELYQRRMELIEHPFGVVKRIWGFDHFLCRGNEMVTGEMAMVFLAFNLRRAVSILGVKKLVEAINTSALTAENIYASIKNVIFSLNKSIFRFERLVGSI